MMIHLMIQNIVMKSITMMRNSGKEMEETLHKLQIAINWPRPFGQADDIKGSGVLKSKHLVLTCVYNFYFNRKLVDKNKVKIYLAPCGELINSL